MLMAWPMVCFSLLMCLQGRGECGLKITGSRGSELHIHLHFLVKKRAVPSDMLFSSCLYERWYKLAKQRDSAAQRRLISL